MLQPHFPIDIDNAINIRAVLQHVRGLSGSQCLQAVQNLTAALVQALYQAVKAAASCVQRYAWATFKGVCNMTHVVLRGVSSITLLAIRGVRSITLLAIRGVCSIVRMVQQMMQVVLAEIAIYPRLDTQCSAVCLNLLPSNAIVSVKCNGRLQIPQEFINAEELSSAISLP